MRRVDSDGEPRTSDLCSAGRCCLDFEFRFPDHAPALKVQTESPDNQSTARHISPTATTELCSTQLPRVCILRGAEFPIVRASLAPQLCHSRPATPGSVNSRQAKPFPASKPAA